MYHIIFQFEISLSLSIYLHHLNDVGSTLKPWERDISKVVSLVRGNKEGFAFYLERSTTFVIHKTLTSYN